MPRPFRSCKSAALALMAALALSSCSIVPRSTIAALHAFDLSTVAAGDLRVAVRLPTAFRFDGGGPAMTVTVTMNGGAPESRRYQMTEVALPAPLAGQSREGAIVRAFALDAQSARELDAYLEDVRATAAPGTRQLAMGLAIEGCRTDGGSGRLPVTTFVQLAPSEPFLVLTRERDLSVLAGMAGVEAVVPAC